MPVEAVQSFDTARQIVYIDREQERIASGLAYDPELLEEPEAYPPYWYPDQRPGFPYFF